MVKIVSTSSARGRYLFGDVWLVSGKNTSSLSIFVAVFRYMNDLELSIRGIATFSSCGKTTRHTSKRNEEGEEISIRR